MEISKFFIFFLIFYHFLLIFGKTRRRSRGVLWLEMKGLIPDAFGMCAGGKIPYPRRIWVCSPAVMF
jgi:hypothetical protein